MAITESVRVVATAEDKRIKVCKWEGVSPKRGAVQIAHGMGEYAQRYRFLAGALASAGYDVYANDHRGHGELAAQADELGDFGKDGFPALVADMVELTRLARGETLGKPIVLLGHSMGSHAAQLYLLDHSELVDGVALSGTNALDLMTAAAAAGRWRLEDLNAGFEPARTSFDWLSRDPTEVDKYVADPLCGFNVTPQSLASLFSIAPRLANSTDLARIRRDLPLFLFVGDHDPLNANLAWLRPLIDRYREAGLTDVSWHVYGGARHEVLNETNRSEVVATLLAWINRVATTK